MSFIQKYLKPGYSNETRSCRGSSPESSRGSSLEEDRHKSSHKSSLESIQMKLDQTANILAVSIFLNAWEPTREFFQTRTKYDLRINSDSDLYSMIDAHIFINEPYVVFK